MFRAIKIALLLLLLSDYAFSQGPLDIKFYYEKVGDGFEIMVDNNEYCEVTAILKLTHENVTVSTRNQNTFLIPPRQKHLRLSELRAIKWGHYGFAFTHKEVRGNIKKTSYSKTYPYGLPFSKGKSYLVTPCFLDKITQKETAALDFKMPPGSEVCAVRSGTVIKVVDNFEKFGETANFGRFTNYVIIMHSDGTFARYAHLKMNSSRVKPGDKIMRGKIIALSGKSGWITEPHLHLDIYKPFPSGKLYIKSYFKVGTGHTSIYLKEGRIYSRKYQ